MGTDIRTEISKNSKYYISKDRYLELKHFCMQYHEWEEKIKEITLLGAVSIEHLPNTNEKRSSVENKAMIRSLYFKRMEIVEQSALETDDEIYQYLIKAVTNGLSYSTMRTLFDIPCGKDYFYDRYRRFFWILDKHRE